MANSTKEEVLSKGRNLSVIIEVMRKVQFSAGLELVSLTGF